MQFKQNLTDEDFRNSLSVDKPRSLESIVKYFGCDVNAARLALQRLEYLRLISRVEITGSECGWIKNCLKFDFAVLRDPYGMYVISPDVFEDVLDCYNEYGQEVAFKLFLATLNGQGYPLDSGLILLNVDYVTTTNNEFVFTCSYPVNCPCRVYYSSSIDPRDFVVTYNSDGDINNEFVVIIEPDKKRNTGGSL